MKTFINLLLIGILLSSISFPQESKAKEAFLTGSLLNDSKTIFEEMDLQYTNRNLLQTSRKKSAFLSGLLSALLPGAGQFYNEDYWKTGLFMAVEAAVISFAVIYDNKGDVKTNEFQNYADSKGGWSAVKYAEWLNRFELEPGDGIPINPDESLPPWERVNFGLINAREEGSHKLPSHGEQQYYELIGKYHQFSPGWAEFDPNSTNIHNVPAQMLFYSQMRGEANDLYGIASTAVIGIYVNHILSVVEAVWSTAKYNKNLSVNFRLQNEVLLGKSQLIPTVKIKYSF